MIEYLTIIIEILFWGLIISTIINVALLITIVIQVCNKK